MSFCNKVSRAKKKQQCRRLVTVLANSELIKLMETVPQKLFWNEFFAFDIGFNNQYSHNSHVGFNGYGDYNSHIDFNSQDSHNNYVGFNG